MTTKGNANYELKITYEKDFGNYKGLGKISGFSTTFYLDLKDIQEQIDLYINNGYEIIKIEVNKMEKGDAEQ